ncbi:MAG: hypothetical protein IGR92_01940 [Leptolyngbyaceae cyanobacterium T60_A2020_046]|nr:hypothetical protein [Leptolyngbyaceae cyanobacterium T60_A2020_046]
MSSPPKIGIQVSPEHPALLEGLEVLLQLGLITDGQTRRIALTSLRCRLPEWEAHARESWFQSMVRTLVGDGGTPPPAAGAAPRPSRDRPTISHPPAGRPVAPGTQARAADQPRTAPASGASSAPPRPSGQPMPMSSSRGRPPAARSVPARPPALPALGDLPWMRFVQVITERLWAELSVVWLLCLGVTAGGVVVVGAGGNSMDAH